MTELVSTLIQDRNTDDYGVALAIAAAVVIVLSSLVALVPAELAAQGVETSSSVIALL